MTSFHVLCRVGNGDPFMRDAGFGYYYPDPDEVSACAHIDLVAGVWCSDAGVPSMRPVLAIIKDCLHDVMALIRWGS